MRYAIISDIHSNLESLIEFFRLLPKYHVEKIVCLGDIVGYNANPNECVELISRINPLAIIRGNHDKASAFRDTHNFSFNAAEVIKWTTARLTKNSLYFLKFLDKGPKIIDKLFGVCHGSALDENKYILSLYGTKPEFNWLKTNKIKILFFGHTHMQRNYYIDNKGYADEITNKNFILNPNYYYLLNPGSIGQPRDNDPRASFMIFDSDSLKIDVIRFEYPINITRQKIINNQLPEFLADRLRVGR